VNKRIEKESKEEYCKRNEESKLTKNESPNRGVTQSGEFSFILAKHPVGYLLSLWSPPNHLMI